jgi:hypothetical protein
MPATKENDMDYRSSVSARAKRAILLSGLALAGITVAARPAQAITGGTTTVKVVSFELRIYDPAAYDHTLSIQDDGPNSVWIGDVTGSVIVGAGCTPKTISSVAGATCPKSGFGLLRVTYIGGDDDIFDWRIQLPARTVIANLGAGADYFFAVWNNVNPTEVYGGFGNDMMVGSKSNDKFYGGDNDDNLDGSQVSGAQVADTLDGGVGNDTITSKNGMGSDSVVCGLGTDSASTDLSDTATGCETVTH